MKFKFLFIVLFPISVFSQYKISGKVIDNESKPLQSSEIVIMTKDSLNFKSDITDDNGFFLIPLDKGLYIFQIKYIGKVVYSESIDLIKSIDLGAIKVSNTQKLEEVVVTTKRKLIERKVDRLVFNVDNSVSTTGGDALDALKVTPGIKVQNDAIKMIGKSGMAVMIDDRIIQLSGEDLINFLKTISSDNIKMIEVISTPPAKYSAEGNSGLVNIKLKKGKKESWNATFNSAYKQSTYPTGNLSSSFNYQKDKITFFSNLNGVNGSSAPIETSKIYYPSGIWNNNSKRRDFYKSFGARIGVDYQVSKKSSMGLQYFGTSSMPNIEENNLTSVFNNQNVIDFYIKTDAINLKNNNSQSLNYHAIFDIDTIGTKVSIDLDYFKYHINDNRTFNSESLDTEFNSINSSYYSANNKSSNGLTNYSGKIDVEMPLQWLNISFGGKIASTQNNSEVTYFNLTSGIPVYDLNQSNLFKYKESIASLYFSGKKKIGEKWEIQAGLRMESTKTDGISLTLNQESINNYYRFFPTSYIAYNFNDNNSFSLNYSKRINRPYFFSLNPFRWYDNPYSYSEGNPFLQPSYSHNLEFTYNHNQNWDNKIYYSKTIDGFSQLTSLDINTNIQATKYTNFFNTQILGISESYTFNTIKWFESVNSLDLSYSDSDSKINITNQNRHGFNSFFSTNNSLNLNKSKTVIVNVNFWINPKGVSDLDKSTLSNQLDLSLKFFFLERKLQLGIVGNDILSSNRPTYISFTNGIKQEYKNYYDNRFFRISLIYKIGNNKMKVEKRDFGNEEEKNRTK